MYILCIYLYFMYQIYFVVRYAMQSVDDWMQIQFNSKLYFVTSLHIQNTYDWHTIMK